MPIDRDRMFKAGGPDSPETVTADRSKTKSSRAKMIYRHTHTVDRDTMASLA